VDTEEKQIVGQADHVIQYVANLIDNTKQWQQYAADMVQQGNAGEVVNALTNITTNLAELEKHHALTASIVAGLQESLVTAVAQRDKKAADLASVEATFDEQVHFAAREGLNEMLEYGYFDEAEVEALANRMIEEGPEKIRNKAQEILEEQLVEAETLYKDWSGQGVTTPPGLLLDTTFKPDPAFDPTDPYNALDEDGDEDLDDDDDFLGDEDDVDIDDDPDLDDDEGDDAA
jgi:hemerythrin